MENKENTLMENEFEQYWQAHRRQLLQASEEYRRVENSYKLETGADWLLFGIPFFAGIIFMNTCRMGSELIRWVLSALVTITCFIACVWLKGILSGNRPLSEIEKEVKEAERQRFLSHHSTFTS